MQSAASRLPAPFAAAAGIIATFPRLIGAASTAITLFGAGVAKSLSEFAKFETAIARIATTTGGTLVQVESQYADLIQQIARDTGVATEDIAAGVQKAISGGVRDYDEVTQLVTEAAKFQAAAFGDVATAVSATTTVFANFRQAGFDTVEVMNAIAIAAQQGEGDFTDFSPAFKRLSGQAKLLGVDLGSLAGTLASISQTAPSVAEGVIQIEGFLKALIKPSQQAEDAMRGLGTSAQELRDALAEEGIAALVRFVQRSQQELGTAGVALLGQLFRDQQGIQAVANLSADEIVRVQRLYADSLENTVTEISRSFGEIETTIDLQLNRLEQTWVTGWQDIGEGIAEAIGASGIVEALNEVLGGAFEVADAILRWTFPGYANIRVLQEYQRLQGQIKSDTEDQADAVEEVGRALSFTADLSEEATNAIAASLRRTETEGQRLLRTWHELDALIESERGRGVPESELKPLIDAANAAADAYERFFMARERALSEQLNLDALELDLERLRPTADVGSEAYYAQARAQLEARLAADLATVELQYAGSAERIASQQALVHARYVNDLGMLNADAVASAEYLANAYQDTLRGAVDQATEAILRFDDSFEGWVRLAFQDLPRIIGLVEDATKAYQSLFAADSGGGVGGFFRTLFGGRRQYGGSVAGGQAYLVGEAGPELFVPGGSGNILPSGAFGGLTVNVEVVDRGGDVTAQIDGAIPRIASAVRAANLRERM